MLLHSLIVGCGNILEAEVELLIVRLDSGDCVVVKKYSKQICINFEGQIRRNQRLPFFDSFVKYFENNLDKVRLYLKVFNLDGLNEPLD